MPVVNRKTNIFRNFIILHGKDEDDDESFVEMLTVDVNSWSYSYGVVTTIAATTSFSFSINCSDIADCSYWFTGTVFCLTHMAETWEYW